MKTAQLKGNMNQMQPKLDPHWLDIELVHKHSGNGYAICELLPPDYVRVCSVKAKGVHDQAFLAWLPMLRPWLMKDRDGKINEVPLPPDNKLAEIRNGLALGQLKVENARIVKA